MNRDYRFFADYALTGSFFWLTQYFVLLLLDPSGEKRLVDLVAAWIQAGIETLPKGIKDSTVAIAFLALIGVFFTGLVLDWFKISFRSLEMDAFLGHLTKNDGWLNDKIRSFSPYHDYYENFKEADTGSTSLFAQILFFLPRFGQKKKRQDAAKTDYVNVHSFLISYVLLSSNGSDLGPLTEGMRLWRTGREISVALLIIVWEVLLILVFRLLSLLPLPSLPILSNIVSVYERAAQAAELPSGLEELPTRIANLGLLNVLVASIVTIWALKGALSILRALFDRVCYALLPMFYVAVTQKHETEQ